MLSEIGKIVQKEIKKLCSNNYHSIIREHSPTALEYYSWRTIILEVMHKAPTLYTIIDKCLMSSNESSRHLLCVVASVVLKSRNPHMCMVQAMVSILMYAGHAGKQVCLCTILLMYSPHAHRCSTDYRNLVCAYHDHPLYVC